jgi:hypothetical protein
MPPPPPPPVRPDASPPARFLACSRVLFAPLERIPGAPARAAAVEPIPYRRCPVGVISALDCPELVGAPCLHHDPRGARAPAVVPRAEVELLARELADTGYLTEAYRRRIAALRTEPAPKRPLPRTGGGVRGGDAAPAPSPRREPVAGREPVRAPVNVPSDEARRARAARRSPS